MSLFSFSLSHTLTVFLSIFTWTAPPQAKALTCVFLTMAEWLSYFSSLFLHQLFPQGRMTLYLCFSSLLKAEWYLFSFFSSLQFSACSTCLSQVSLRDMASLHQLCIKPKVDFVGLRRQAHKWALRKVCWDWGCQVHPIISPSSTLRKRSSTQVFN